MSKADMMAREAEDATLIAEMREEISSIGERMEWTVLQNAKAQAAIPGGFVPDGGKTLPERVAALVERLNESNAEIEALKARVEAAEERTIDIVFDGELGPVGPHFVEVESPPGVSISFGEWVRRSDGYQVLRFEASTCTEIAALKAKVDAAEGLRMKHAEAYDLILTAKDNIDDAKSLLFASGLAMDQAAREAGLGEKS